MLSSELSLNMSFVMIRTLFIAHFSVFIVTMYGVDRVLRIFDNNISCFQIRAIVLTCSLQLIVIQDKVFSSREVRGRLQTMFTAKGL